MFSSVKSSGTLLGTLPLNITGVPVYRARSDRVVLAVYTKLISHDGACHAFLLDHLESLRRENFWGGGRSTKKNSRKGKF